MTDEHIVIFVSHFEKNNIKYQSFGPFDSYEIARTTMKKSAKILHKQWNRQFNIRARENAFFLVNVNDPDLYAYFVTIKLERLDY